jgi:hypothetical protein
MSLKRPAAAAAVSLLNRAAPSEIAGVNAGAATPPTSGRILSLEGGADPFAKKKKTSKLDKDKLKGKPPETSEVAAAASDFASAPPTAASAAAGPSPAFPVPPGGGGGSVEFGAAAPTLKRPRPVDAPFPASDRHLPASGPAPDPDVANRENNEPLPLKKSRVDPSVADPAASAGGRAVKKAEKAQLLSVPGDGPVRKDNSS